MKKSILVAGILILFVYLIPVWAQWEMRATAAVPFEFMVGETVLPAGDYAVGFDQRFPNAIRVLNTKTNQSAIVLENNILFTDPGEIATSSKLIFARDGSRHVLHQVVLAQDNHKHDVIHKAEITELAQAK